MWYFRTVLTAWYFRTVLTAWYFRTVLTAWYFRSVRFYNCPDSVVVFVFLLDFRTIPVVG